MLCGIYRYRYSSFYIGNETSILLSLINKMTAKWLQLATVARVARSIPRVVSVIATLYGNAFVSD